MTSLRMAHAFSSTSCSASSAGVFLGELAVKRSIEFHDWIISDRSISQSSPTLEKMGKPEAVWLMTRDSWLLVFEIFLFDTTRCVMCHLLVCNRHLFQCYIWCFCLQPFAILGFLWCIQSSVAGVLHGCQGIANDLCQLVILWREPELAMSRNQPFASGLFSRVTLGLVLAVNAHVKVMMIHNSLEASFGWREGFYDFFVPFLDEEVDEESHGGLNVSLCGDILDAAKVQSCLDSASSLDIDAIVVATSTLTSEIKDAAEQYKIPNIHCSGLEVW